MRRHHLGIALACALSLASACTGPTASTSGLPNASSAVRAQGRAPFAGSLPSELLFVPTEQGSIDIYPLKHPAKRGIVGQISGLVGQQQQMAVDASNDLFVVNNGVSADEDFVAEYAPPYGSPPTILNTAWQSEIFFPIGVAVDAEGTVYVSNCGAYCLETPAVFVYSPGATSPSKALTSPKFNSLAGVTLDAHGNLYVVNWNDTTFATDVFEMRAGAKEFRPMRLHGLDTGNGGNGLSFDAAGNLYVAANSSGSNYILEYRPGSRNAFHMIDSLPFTVEPTMMDVGPDGNLYTGASCTFQPCTFVYGFRPGAKRPFLKLGSSQQSAFILGVATAPNFQLQKGQR